MKRILFVIDNLNLGGVEKSLISLLNYIDTKEYEIDILPLVSKGILENEITKKNITVLQVPDSKFDTRLLSDSFKETVLGYIKKVSMRDFFKLIYLFIKGKFNPMIRKLKISELVRCSIIDSLEYNDTPYDVAVGYIDRQYSYYVIKKVKAMNKIMWIHSDYNVVDDFIKGYYSTYKEFNSIICVSNKAKISFLEKFPTLSDKISIINNILDTKKMDNAIPYDFGNDCIRLIAVGRLSREKRFLKLIDDFYEISLRIKKKIMLYIIGDGPEFSIIKNKIQEYNLTEKIIMLGQQENPYQYIKSADIFLQPSINEGYCLTVYEALYLRKFVVAFDIADIKDSISNKNGIICKNDTDFINNTVHAIENELYKTNSSSYLSNYNDNIIKKIIKLFNESR